MKILLFIQLLFQSLLFNILPYSHNVAKSFYCLQKNSEPKHNMLRTRILVSTLEMRTKKNNDNDNGRHTNGGILKKKFIYYPLGHNQKKYVEFLENYNTSIIIGTGPAGCGKTLFACSAAVQALRNGHVDRIVMTRPLISVDDEEIGFLPGSLVQKMDPWTRPIFDILGEFYSKIQIHSMIQNGVIEISPLAYMRGRTFKRAFVIADEMQNSSPNQMLMMLTRIGDNSKLVVTGDVIQSDRTGINGLGDLIHKINQAKIRNVSNYDSIQTVHLNNQDVYRSNVVKQILDIYQTPHHSIDPVNELDSVNDIDPVKHLGFNSSKNRTRKRPSSDDAALMPVEHIRPTIF